MDRNRHGGAKPGRSRPGERGKGLRAGEDRLARGCCGSYRLPPQRPRFFYYRQHYNGRWGNGYERLNPIEPQKHKSTKKALQRITTCFAVDTEKDRWGDGGLGGRGELAVRIRVHSWF